MNTKFIILLCFLIVTFYKCNQRDSIQNLLTSDCFWDIWEKNSNHPINSCYKFDDKGNCNFFYYNFYDKQKTDSVFLYDDGDVIVSNHWKLKNDSSILIRGLEYRITRYNVDSIFLKASRNDVIVLIRNCKTYKSSAKSGIKEL